MPFAEYEKLCEVTAGKQVTMMGVSEHAASFLQFLSKAGLIPGSVVSVLEINDFDRSMLLKINESGPSFVSYEVARNILIKFSV